MVYLVRTIKYFAGVGHRLFVIKFDLAQNQNPQQGLAFERAQMIKLQAAAGDH